MNICYFLIGLPGTGKSTWMKENHSPDIVILSTDAYIEAYAANHGTTYNAVFQDAIKDAEKHMYQSLKQAIDDGKSIIWDQTNLTRKARAKKLAMLPKYFDKRAYAFLTSDEISGTINEERRRIGRSIPEHIIQGMKSTYQPPSTDEGFSQIVTIERY